MPAETRTRRRRIALTIAVLLFLAVMYPLSFGPACWIMARCPPTAPRVLSFAFHAAYGPVAEHVALSRGTMRKVANDWIALGLPADTTLWSDIDDSDGAGIVFIRPGYTQTVIWINRDPEERAQ